MMSLVFFLGACSGHAAWLVFVMNLCYSTTAPRLLLRIMRRILEPLILSAPLLFFFAYDLARFLTGRPPSESPWRAALAAYGYGCCVLGFGLVPPVTVLRLLRRRPHLVVSNDTRTVDVAKELGHRPYGHGKYRHVARLPRNEIFQVDFTELTLRPPRLPRAWDGLKVLHLSDLHFCGTPDKQFYSYVMDRCREWEPDLVALTGDVVDTSRHHRWIIPVLGRLRWKVAAFAILGNHDSWFDVPVIRRRLRRIGLNVLGNGWEQIEVRGEPLTVIGHEGPWFWPPADLTGCPLKPFRLCLSHTPDNIRWARQHGVDLMLSGHNHGGQIRFPVIGSVFVPSRYSRRYDCGTFYEPPTLLHVNRGLAGKHPLRFNCRPEVNWLVLRAPEAGTTSP